MRKIAENYKKEDCEFRSYKGITTMKKLKQDHVINGLLPCLSEIISKRMIKNPDVVRKFNKVIVDYFMKFRD